MTSRALHAIERSFRLNSLVTGDGIDVNPHPAVSADAFQSIGECETIEIEHFEILKRRERFVDSFDSIHCFVLLSAHVRTVTRFDGVHTHCRGRES